MTGDYLGLGWQILAKDPKTERWAEAARLAALEITRDPAQQAKWLRHGKTWFVGVDSLPNAGDGSIGGVPLTGPWEQEVTLPNPLHQAQLSVVYPGYPRRDPDESEAAHRFRRDRDAAHVDGLLAEGPDKRRHLREPHAFILGLPLNRATASPLVVWEGSHEIIREAFLSEFAGLPPEMWPDTDVTEVYKEARAEAFDLCERRVLTAEPGQSILVHRLAVHGVAPWEDDAKAPPEGRMVAYFRPLATSLKGWLRDD